MSPALARAIQAEAFPDVWAVSLKLAVDGAKFDLRGREYQRQIIRDESPWIVMPKGAQLGLTTIFLVRTFHWMTKRSWKHLYLLPLKTGTVPFVQGRVDTIIKSNPELAKMFASVSNRMHKQTINDINLHFRGTNIATELREVPADVLVLDERDKMVKENLPEAMARLDGSDIRRVTELSTPTVPGHGVDDEDGWPASDQHRWWVPCPHCNRTQVLTFEENVFAWLGESEHDSILCCKHCKKQITDDERAAANEFGTWQPENLQGTKRGYHLSQLNSPTKPLRGYLENYFLGQDDSTLMRAFHNNNKGEPYVALGDKLTPEILDKCRTPGHLLGGIPFRPVYIGVDVQQQRLYLKASQLDHRGNRISWDFQIITNREGRTKWYWLDDYFSRLGSFVAVIDADPARAEVEELALKYHGRVWMGFEKDAPAQPETAMFSPIRYGEVCKVSIERTMAFDNVVNSYIKGRTILPPSAREIGEHMPGLSYNGFYHQMIQQVRTHLFDAKENLVARWVKNKNPDHWHHADMFEWCATQQEAEMVIEPGVGQLLQAAGGFIR